MEKKELDLFSDDTLNYKFIEDRLLFVCKWRVAEGWVIRPSDLKAYMCPLGAACSSEYPNGTSINPTHREATSFLLSFISEVDRNGFSGKRSALELFVRDFIGGFDAHGESSTIDRTAREMGARFRERALQGELG